MDWGALCHRLSSDYGWTAAEIFGMTVSEVLVYWEFRERRPTSIVASPGLAMEIATAARERRAVQIEAELKRWRVGFEVEAQVEAQVGAWERLVALTLSEPRETAADSTTIRDRARDVSRAAMLDAEWLKKIHDELRTLRQALTTSAGRTLLTD